MASLLIRNLDDAVIVRLKARARENSTSTEEEARRALGQQVGGVDDWLERLARVRAANGSQQGLSTAELLRIDRDRDGAQDEA